MDIKQFIVQSLEGKPVQAKETLNDLLSNRAFEALDYKKQQIAKTLYGDGEDTEVQNTEDENYEEEMEHIDEVSSDLIKRAADSAAKKSVEAEVDRRYGAAKEYSKQYDRLKRKRDLSTLSKVKQRKMA